jgi:hypothetical protein
MALKSFITLGSGLLPTTEIKTEIKEEVEVKQEPFDDYWPEIPASQSNVGLDQILRKDIKRECLPFEVQEKLQMLMINEKPVPPPCGCIQV